jgi:ricin-type beta-trefoil lectin protein
VKQEPTRSHPGKRCDRRESPPFQGRVEVKTATTPTQVFIPQANGSLYNPQSGKCLDDTNWATNPGVQLQIWDCTGNANQKWNLP